jgi:AcrR family transcriptional regulator
MPSTSPPRKGRPVDRGLPQRRREEILVAATRFFARHGYLNADIELLADELDIGKGTIYRYFSSKEHLFTSALVRGLSALHDAVAQETSALNIAAKRDDDGLAILTAAIHAYFTYFDRNPDLIELMVLERAEMKGRGKPTYFSHRERYLGPWRTRLRSLMADGQIRTMDVEAIISSIGMLMYGALVTHPFMSGKRGLATQARDVLDIVLHGIRASTNAHHPRSAP